VLLERDMKYTEAIETNMKYLNKISMTQIAKAIIDVVEDGIKLKKL